MGCGGDRGGVTAVEGGGKFWQEYLLFLLLILVQGVGILILFVACIHVVRRKKLRDL